MENSFACILSELRRKRGLSQRKVAADLKISQALLSHYENGAREPGLNFVGRACDYYGVTADYILGRTGSVQNSDRAERMSLFLNEVRSLSEKAEKLMEEFE